MQNAPPLDLGLDRAALSPRSKLGPFPRTAVLILAALIGSIMLSAAIVPRALGRFGAENEPLVRISLDRLREVSAMSVDDKTQILVEGLAAQQKNAEIPVSALPIEAVRGFSLSAVSPDTYGAALTCLTQAVYYEAANEPMQGRRAVAQVVLNRMRHPAYPKSVCGVVYQGSERRTGCQFSFTCDGSLLRSPTSNAWREAQDVARAALSGEVEPSVGTATHYHADYVLPKWAFALGKIEQLGRHIFYRFTGGWGRSGAFTGRYSGDEHLPRLDFAALQLRMSASVAGAETQLLVPGLTVAHEPSDRHTPSDVAGRIDVTKPWRLAIPDPVAASSRYREALGEPAAPASHSADIAAADPSPVAGDSQSAGLR